MGLAAKCQMVEDILVHELNVGITKADGSISVATNKQTTELTQPLWNFMHSTNRIRSLSRPKVTVFTLKGHNLYGQPARPNQAYLFQSNLKSCFDNRRIASSLPGTINKCRYSALFYLFHPLGLSSPLSP